LHFVFFSASSAGLSMPAGGHDAAAESALHTSRAPIPGRRTTLTRPKHFPPKREARMIAHRAAIPRRRRTHRMIPTQVRTLPKALGSFQLWGIAVGLVISGEYFGWSYGWDKAGTLGFLVTSAFIALMYTTFIFSFTELTTAIPNAGGPFEYSRRAFGPVGGYIAGFATLVEFVFAPPAIALAIGAYVNVQF